jgi:hypothetical protein
VFAADFNPFATGPDDDDAVPVNETVSASAAASPEELVDEANPFEAPKPKPEAPAAPAKPNFADSASAPTTS